MAGAAHQTIYLALGTNLGDRLANLTLAIDRIAAQVAITAQSAIYETEPWGITEQPRFLNMALRGETTLPPRDLLRFLKGIERVLGRAQGIRYGPRLIDIDILFYADHLIDEGDLQIPHPRLHERAFVLVPLADIAPSLTHPQHGTTVAEMLAAVGTAGITRLSLAPGATDDSSAPR